MAKSELNDWGRPDYKRADLGELVRGRYAKLSKSEREKVESEYHRMKPEEFDKLMSRAKPHAASAMNRSTFRSRSKRKGKAPETRRAS